MYRNPQALANGTYDVLVIGGGIFGACSAWEASRSGLRVALIEKVDFGHATSANSLKTIHGGLRYLGRGQLRTMRRFAREQALFTRLAPHLVHSIRFVLPFDGSSILRRGVFSAGLNLHRLLNGSSNLPEAHWISEDEMRTIGLGAAGAITWQDAQVYDSERLTLAFVMTAAKAGAEVANYVEALEFLLKNGRVTGVRVRDALSDDTFDIRSRIVINAAGPWMGRFSNGALPRKLQFVKAINVLVPQLEAEYALGLPSNGSGRLFFVPWRGTTMIGTAYSTEPSEPDGARATEQEIDDLLEAASEAIREGNFSRSDVKLVHCGLVPVNVSNGRPRRNGSYRSVEQPGVISIIGSKYTMARGTAERTVDQVFNKFGYRGGRRSIDPLIGGGIEDIETYLAEAVTARPAGVRESTIRDLVYSYGTEYLQILTDDAATDESILRGRVTYAIENEMAQTLPDVVFRRTGLGTAGHPGDAAVRYCAEVMGAELGWNPSRVQDELGLVSQQFRWHLAEPEAAHA